MDIYERGKRSDALQHSAQRGKCARHDSNQIPVSSGHQSEKASSGIQDHAAKKSLGYGNLVHASRSRQCGENEASVRPSSVVSIEAVKLSFPEFL
jgi:hypothetical protein